jgi:hypothetical protein
MWFAGEPIRFMKGHAGHNKGRPEYIVNPHTGCWIWNRAQRIERKQGAYGAYYEGGKVRLAHIAVYEREHGPTPPDLELHHRCVEEGYGSTLCVNPAHLRLVTHAVNAQRGKNAKLTPTAVKKIRLKYASGDYTQSDLGQDYGVGQDTISSIVNRKTWQNV